MLVIVDTLRADHLGVYGHRRSTSITMDALADQGMWFHRSYAASGWTLPSMATLFSGLHPHQHLVGRLAFRGTEFGKLDASFTTVADCNFINFATFGTKINYSIQFITLLILRSDSVAH